MKILSVVLCAFSPWFSVKYITLRFTEKTQSYTKKMSLLIN